MDLFALLENNLSPEKKVESAILGNRVSDLENLLQGGIDPNTPIQFEGGNRPLHIAARQGYFLCVEKLLEYNANPQIKNDFNLTPIALAFRKHQTKCVEILLRVNRELWNLEQIWSQLDGAMTLWNSSNDKMISVLIKATPDLSRTRSNLQINLFHLCKTKSMYNCLKIMTYGGYNFAVNQMKTFTNGDQDKQFLDWLKKFRCSPHRLQHYCRTVIRRNFHGNCNVMFGSEVLPLPQTVKQFIILKDDDYTDC